MFDSIKILSTFSVTNSCAQHFSLNENANGFSLLSFVWQILSLKINFDINYRQNSSRKKNLSLGMVHSVWLKWNAFYLYPEIKLFWFRLSWRRSCQWMFVITTNHQIIRQSNHIQRVKWRMLSGSSDFIGMIRYWNFLFISFLSGYSEQLCQGQNELYR